MYIDLVVLLVLIIFVILFYKRFSTVVFTVVAIDMLLRILTFIKENIGLNDVKKLIGKYIPSDMFAIINKYTSGTINILLKWVFVGLLSVCLYFIIKMIVKKKRI